MKDNPFQMKFVSEPTVVGGAYIPHAPIKRDDIIRLSMIPSAPPKAAATSSVNVYNAVLAMKNAKGVLNAIQLYRQLQPGASLMEAKYFVDQI